MARKAPMPPGIDLEADAQSALPEIGDNQIKSVSAAANELLEAEATVERLKTELTAATERVLVLRRSTLPIAMEGVGQASFTLTNGFKVEVRDIIVGTLPSKKDDPIGYAKAMEWFRGHAGDLIKNEVAIAFGKGQDDIAHEFLAIAKGFVAAQPTLGLAPSQEETIHYQTLQAWLRERLKSGLPIPDGIFGNLYTGKEAKVIPPKE